MEIWKSVKGYEDLYEISNLGRVKSLHFGKERILKGTKGNHEYLSVGMCKDGKNEISTIHRLVACAFLNHEPNGNKLVIDHINNIKKDNRLENLQIITQRKNLSKDKKKGYSKYTGVYLNKEIKKWYSLIYLNGKLKYLGIFESELEASNTYQKALKGL
tara:strand:- start:1024 stop:1500 length:477 start_codon:yes stop_codon:yes gene_type:complete